LSARLFYVRKKFADIKKFEDLEILGEVAVTEPKEANKKTTILQVQFRKQ